MSRIETPNHDNCTLITDSTGTWPLVLKCKRFFHLGLYEIFVSSWLKQDVINSDHIIWLLTLHNFPSLVSPHCSGAAPAATKNDYVLLTVHDHRCVFSPLLAEKKDVF